MTGSQRENTPERFTDVLSLPVGQNLELGALIGPRGAEIGMGCDFVVYFPGLGASKEYFEPCLVSSRLQRFTGFALDPLGMGDSALPHPDEQSYRIQEQATLVNQILDLLVARGVCKSITIVAHSWGEAVALAALQQKSREIHRYVSVAGGVTGGPLDAPEQYLSHRFLDAMLPRILYQLGVDTTDATPREKTFARRILVECIDSFLRERESLLRVFDSLHCPRYFMCGAKDTCSGVDGFTEKIAIPNAGHNLIHDDPAAFNTELSRILGEVDKPHLCSESEP